MKFILCANPREGMSIDQFDYEWSVMHPTLMVTTPSVMAGFLRYVQHRTAAGATDEHFMYGRHEHDWYAMSDHWLVDLDALMAIFQGEDYPRRMAGHAFGGVDFVIELMEGAVLHDQPVPFTGRGGVKLINFVARDADVDQQAFESRWCDDYAKQVLSRADDAALMRYVQNTQLPLDASLFKGSLFEAGGVQTYAGIEELWFEDLDALAAWCRTATTQDGLLEAADGLIDADRSFSMVTVERVVWDYTSANPSPRPAMENPDSLEAQLVKNELPPGGWNQVRSLAE
jgi:hypothetical protein